MGTANGIDLPAEPDTGSSPGGGDQSLTVETAAAHAVETAAADQYAMRKDLGWLGADSINPSTGGTVEEVAPVLVLAKAEAQVDEDKEVAIEAIEATSADEHPMRKDMGWLGLSTTEASDTLTSQLNLKPGVGLIVNFVSPESPAAKAGFQKNDVLVRIDDQSLVHPAQFRKLVQGHKAGDSIKVAFYRGGKEQTVSVTLGKASAAGTGSGEEKRLLEFQFDGLKHAFQDDGGLRDQINIELKNLRDVLGNLKVEQEVKDAIRKSMDEARQAVREALRNSTNAEARKALEEISRARVIVGDKPTLIVSKGRKGVKSMVKTDDSGTIVLVANPKLRLTAHDKDGKLLFDGSIDTKDERDKVPKDVWERVEPMLEKMGKTVTVEAEEKDE